MIPASTSRFAQRFPDIAQRHRSRLLLDAGASTSSTFAGGKKVGGPGGTKAIDLQAFALSLAAYLSEPRTAQEMADHFGIGLDGMFIRRTKANKAGFWPPKGKRQAWKRNSYGPPSLHLLDEEV